MRVRSLLIACFWVAAFVWIGYNGMQAVSSYFRTNDIAETAFRTAADKQRARAPGEAYSPEFLADLRTGLLMGTRKSGIEVDPTRLKVVYEGGLIQVDVNWTYHTWPLTTWGWDTAIPVPLWLDRSFDPQLGVRRIF